MVTTADIVALETATRARLFDGTVQQLLARYNCDRSPLPSSTGNALTTLLVSYNEHKVCAWAKTGGERLHHLNRLGVIREKMRDISDGDATSLLRAADDNIEKALRSFGHNR